MSSNLLVRLRCGAACACLLALSACAGSSSSLRPLHSETAVNATDAASTTSSALGESAPYGGPPGAVREASEPTRDLDERSGSRMYLLDLYQKAMDEKDALALEVSGLETALAREQGAIDEALKERNAFAAKAQALEQENAKLTAENADLAARLTTAQIRRLEAEKLLLEARIEWQRAQEAAIGSQRAGSSRTRPEGAPSNMHPLQRALERADAGGTSPAHEHGQEGRP